MTHDPYQTYPTFAAYPAVTNPGLSNPFGSPYTAMQISAINPATGYNPFAVQQPGIQGLQGIAGLQNYGNVGNGPERHHSRGPSRDGRMHSVEAIKIRGR